MSTHPNDPTAVEELSMPTNTCRYDHYDPETLEPLNSDTYIRLKELGWTREDFEGKSVLDIGCNSGLLTMHAVQLGAASVHACEMQEGLASFVRRVVERQGLPVEVTRTPFHKLEASEHQADIVLFMEVLHWAVDQGLSQRDAIARLARLTRETLYLEFPWSVAEPSIQAQTELTESTYSADAILDELTRHFSDVTVVGFMHYFSLESDSKRLLVKARGKRPESELLAALPGVHSLDRSLSRGRNQSYLLAGRQGLLVGKLLDERSRLSLLPDRLCNKLFHQLRAAAPSAIVPPERIDGGYTLPVEGGRRFMLFPYVGTPLSGPNPPPPPEDSVLELFASVRRDFRCVGPGLLAQLRKHRLVIRDEDVGNAEAPWRQAAEPYLPVDDLDAFLEANRATPRLFDGLNHGDLHLGNFVAVEGGGYRVVDLDNLVVGTIYSDGILGLIWRGGPVEAFAKLCDLIGRDETRQVQQADVVVAVAHGLRWFAAARDLSTSTIRPNFERFGGGIGAAMRFAKTLPRAPAQSA